MDTVKEFVREHPYLVAGGLVVPLAFVMHHSIKGSRKPKRRECPANTVLLYQLNRGPYAPSMSPFPMKLETYLRMAKIPYINDFSSQMSSKGKTPWMSYNGEDVADSQFCIDYLNKKLNIDPYAGLSKADRAVAKAVQIMVDEHLFWPLVYFRWILDKEKTVLKKAIPSSCLVNWVVPRKAKTQLHGQGIGRHSTEEIKQILLTDLRALEDFLGTKPFLMGKEPTEVDCSAFGMLAQVVWHSSDDVCKNLVQQKYPSLYSYCLRMKDRFWPDWNDCITHGGTKEATK